MYGRCMLDVAGTSSLLEIVSVNSMKRSWEEADDMFDYNNMLNLSLFFISLYLFLYVDALIGIRMLRLLARRYLLYLSPYKILY